MQKKIVQYISYNINTLANTAANRSANIIQAQLDYYVVHLYQKVQKPKGKFYDTQWGNF